MYKGRPKFQVSGSIPASQLGPNVIQAFRASPYCVAPQSMKYSTPPASLPSTFDPRTPAGIPASKVPMYFYTADDGSQNSVIGLSTYQAFCISDWAFTAASLCTDRARIALLRKFGTATGCAKSSLFGTVSHCTGAENLITQGLSVVGAKNNDDRNLFSAYYLLAFSPIIQRRCASPTLVSCANTICDRLIPNWASAAKGIVPAGVNQVLDMVHTYCLSCAENHPITSFLLFSGGSATTQSFDIQRGLPFIESFTAQDWFCVFSGDKLSSTYCSYETLQPWGGTPFPTLHYCDRFAIALASDVLQGRAPVGVASMPDWIKSDIFQSGPVAVVFQVYASFLKWASAGAEGVYTADIFIADYKASPAANTVPQGYHSVSILGWGVDSSGPAPVQYWIVRNTWGVDWGDMGCFLIEIGLDDKVIAAGLAQQVRMEDEFSAPYFAPDPNPGIFTGAVQGSMTATPTPIPPNDLSSYLDRPDATTCMSIANVGASSAALLRRCTCPIGYIASNSGQCIRMEDTVRQQVGLPTGYQFITSSYKKWILVFFVLVLVLLAIVIVAKKRHGAHSAFAPPSAAASSSVA